MPTVAVLIPWAGQCAHRLAALSFVRDWYTRHFPDWQLCIGHAAEGPSWCKAEAVRDALSQTDAEILVVADADCYTVHIESAVQAIGAGFDWAVPHYTVHRLSSEATRTVIEDGTDPASLPRTIRNYTQMPYTGYPGGGITVVSREAYARSPLDPRFTGWGQEDECWAIALRALFGAPYRPQRGPLWHLWHPPQRRSSRAVGSPASQELRTRYRRAARDGTMDAHLAPAVEYTALALTVSAEL